MWLRRVDGQTLVAQLAPGEDGAKVTRAAPFATPWRTVTIADTAGGLVESNLILNLNEPNKLGDVSWFKPHKYVGVWWAMHLDDKSWASGPKHGATTAEVERYIDFAAANGFRGVLVEGWNVGWDGQWFGNGREFDFTRPYPDFDMAALSAYARKKGRAPDRPSRDRRQHLQLRAPAGRRHGLLRGQRRRRGQERLCRGCRRGDRL